MDLVYVPLGPRQPRAHVLDVLITITEHSGGLRSDSGAEGADLTGKSPRLDLASNALARFAWVSRSRGTLQRLLVGAAAFLSSASNHQVASVAAGVSQSLSLGQQVKAHG
jgi:hypothetical protein